MVIALPLDLALEGIFGAALIAAAAALSAWFFNMFNGIPVLGGAARYAAAATIAAINVTVSWSAWSAQTVGDAIQAPFLSIWSAVDANTSTMNAVYSALWRVRFQAIPAVYNWAAAEINAEVSWLLAVIRAQVQWVLAIERADIATVTSELVNAINFLLAWNQRLYEAAVSYAGALFASSIAHTDQVAGAIERDVISRELRDLQYIDEVGRAAERFAQLVGIDAITRADAEFRTAIDYTNTTARALADAMARDFARATDYARAGDAALAIAITAIEELPCIRNCGPLGGLGQLLQEMTDLSLALVLAELVAEGGRHPQEGASAARSALGGFVSGTVDVVRGMVA